MDHIDCKLKIIETKLTNTRDHNDIFAYVYLHICLKYIYNT